MTGKPLPPVTADSRPYWDGCAEGVLRYQYCTACQRAQFPPGSHCRSCAGTAIEWRVSQGDGVIHSLTTVERAPTVAFRGDVPYTIALIDLVEGFRIMAQVRSANARDAAIDARVHVTFEAVGDGVVLPQVELSTK